jgi:UDP-2,4-diacetamido-2,4,6-trideoxy-beta-L-altropyranose hydrolase
MPPEADRLTLLLRADATAQVGAGHFMRSLALAEACVARGGTAVLLSRCDSPALRARAEAAGVRVDALPAGAELDLSVLREWIGANAADAGTWLVVDGYGFDADYLRAGRDCGVRTLVLDDTAALAEYPADAVLNQNLDGPDRAYPTEPGTVLLVGTRYALLRREFLPWRDEVRPIAPDAGRILVTLGGADGANATQRVLDGMASAGEGMEEVRVIVGPANPHRAALEAWAEASALPVRLLDGGTASMPEQMAWADVAVSAAGSTCWELAALGVPSLLLVVADNQAALAREMEARGAAWSLGTLAAATADGIADAVRRLRADAAARAGMRERGRTLVDGAGADRVLDVMHALAFRDDGAMTLRRANEDDALPLLALANDPGVRANAFHPAPIARADHLRWYAGKLASESTAMWVLELAGVLAAQIRYDRTEGGLAEIGYAVSPAFRGMGLGTRILLDTWEPACEALGVHGVRGVVIQGNTASVRAFEKAGFQPAGEVEMHGRACLAFERRVLSAAWAG